MDAAGGFASYIKAIQISASPFVNTNAAQISVRAAGDFQAVVGKVKPSLGERGEDPCGWAVIYLVVDMANID